MKSFEQFKEEKDQAFANVVAKLRAQHGKDSVLTKTLRNLKHNQNPKQNHRNL